MTRPVHRCGAWLLPLALGCLHAFAARGEDAAAKQTKLSPEGEAALSKFVIKAMDAKRAQQKKHVQEVIDQIVKETGLDEATAKKLAESAGPAVEKAIEQWPAQCEEYVRPYAVQAGEQFIEQWQADGVAREVRVKDAKLPEDLPEWRAALTKVLSPEQLGKWDKVSDGQKHGLEKQIAEAIKPAEDKVREATRSKMESEIRNIAGILKLSDDRVAAMGKLADEVSTESCDKWRESVLQFYRMMPEAQRTAMLAEGAAEGGRFGVMPSPDTTDKDLWKTRMQALLSEDERRVLGEDNARRKNKELQGFARLAIVHLDKRVGLTTTQRVKLEPVLAPEMEPFTKHDRNQGDWSSLSATALLAAAGKAKADEVKPLLDEKQWTRWQAACVEKAPTRARAQAVKEPAKADAAAKETPDPEKLISDYLYGSWKKMRDKLVASMLVKVDDAARVLSLKPEAVEHLATAAKGAAEESLVSWKDSAGEWVRGRLRTARPQDVRAQLNGLLEDVGFGRRQAPEESRIWLDSVAQVLDAGQLEVWKKEQDLRKAYEDRTVLDTVMMEFDRRYHLDDAQITKLEPMIARLIEDYTPEINNYFSFNNGAAWYMTSYYTLLPFAGVKEKEAKEVLNPAQWKQWEASDAPRLSQYWSNLEQNHQNRVKRDSKE